MSDNPYAPPEPERCDKCGRPLPDSTDEMIIPSLVTGGILFLVVAWLVVKLCEWIGF